MEIDWMRVAAPQVDGYDTQIILELARSGHYAERLGPKLDRNPPIWPDGRAAWVLSLEQSRLPSAEYSILPVGDQIVQDGLKLLELWPTVRKQCADILVGLCAMTTSRSYRGMGHGCSCGHFGDDFGWIYVTADDPWGFAEGIVHEMGHWKLRALGIWFEDWTPLILDHAFDELYDSPVRKDKPRPMGAVLHAQYSYIHVARMTTLALQSTEKPVQQDIDWAELQLKRITEGQATLRAHARGTLGIGAPFLQGIDAWTTQVIQDGQAICAVARERAAT